jgi:hypothetical protein
MKERPIIFNGEMVRAILDGRKTQTRRVMKPQPPYRFGSPFLTTTGVWIFSLTTAGDFPMWKNYLKCPYGLPGDRLWVRETWAKRSDCEDGSDKAKHYLHYKATYKGGNLLDEWHAYDKWRPSIHMPRWASRITLEIVNVRVERVQEISETDATEEGFSASYGWCEASNCHEANSFAWEHFQNLWDSINAKRGFGWDANPWVWVIEFKRVQA